MKKVRGIKNVRHEEVEGDDDDPAATT